MTTDYSELTPEQQYSTVRQRLLQLEQQHLLATVNQAAAEAAGELEQATAFAAQADKWDKSAGAVRAILSGLPAPAEPERKGTPVPGPRAR